METCGSDESQAGVGDVAAAFVSGDDNKECTTDRAACKSSISSTSKLEEWTIGIEDRPIVSWKKRTPLFEECIRATNQHTFLDVIKELCQTAIRKRRLRFAANDSDDYDDGSVDSEDYENDHGVNGHLWTLKFHAEDYKPFDPYDDSDYDSDRDESNVVLRMKHQWAEDHDYQGQHDIHVTPDATKLSTTLLPEGHVGTFTYDFSKTTEVYLKVLSIRTIHVNEEGEVEDKKKDHFGYFIDAGDQASNERDLFSLEAYHMDKEDQVDAIYPYFARACLGKGVPLYASQPDANWTTGKLTMGLSSKNRSESDTTFCTIEDSSNGSDLMFCPDVMDLTTMFATCDEAWKPKTVLPEEDPDELHQYLYGYILRFVLDGENQSGIANVRHMSESEWGPKILLTTTDSDKIPPEKHFDFEKVFPKTTEHLTSGKFRWFSYNRNGVLRVMVGRAGKDRSIRDSSQVLRTWKQKFHSLHELLCAVEASWILNGESLDAATFLPAFDVNLDPSRPAPIDPPVVASESDAVVLSSPNTKTKLVTTLSLANEVNGDLVVYCGHDDGTLAKWDLDSGKLLFREQIYHPKSSKKKSRFGENEFTCDDTRGVAGLIVREQNGGTSTDGDTEHILYSWTHSCSTPTNGDGSSKIQVRSGKDGSFIRCFSCNVGPDTRTTIGKSANPRIACVVFCRILSDQGLWQDSLIVGLHCLCPGTLYGDGDLSNFNLESAQSIGEGNILPFDLDSAKPMKTWRGHNGMIRAMAVVPDKYLFSYSVKPGCDQADAMILWDLKRPGVPLSHVNLWNPNAPRLKQSLTRLHAVVGISVHGKNVLLACEYGYQVAVTSIEDDDGAPNIRICGYASLFPHHDGVENYYGSMAMSGRVIAMVSNDQRKAWLFYADNMESHPKLDHRDGGFLDFCNAANDFDDAMDEDDYVDFYAGRHLVQGTVDLPDMSSFCRYGGDGPLTLAVRGKHLVAGYANGAIVEVKLPDEFAHRQEICGSGQCGLASCSWFSSEKNPSLWHEKGNTDAWYPFEEYFRMHNAFSSFNHGDSEGDS